MVKRPDPTAALLSRFRRQRPLRTGSLIVTIFGDLLAPRGGAISLGSLIKLLARFGPTERLVRTSVARLAHDGWLEGRRAGRLSEYRLSGTGRQRFQDATRRIYAGPAPDWPGRWTLVLLAGVDAPARTRVRDLLRWEGFGEPESGLLAHPAFAAADARALLGRDHAGDGAIVLESRAGSECDDLRLVERGWDLSELAARYLRFIDAFEAVRAWSREPSLPADAFVVRTLLIHEYRKIHLRDPLLPPALLPGHWPGTRAYELCRAIYEGVFAAAERHLSATAARLDGPLPAPEPAIYRRFAGLPRGG
ncbi:MAG: phenylacetic acid degradation operon negative regulatory protein PaaX [Proteobacteria bacterium]|nr:phenylacetic acid degradation operon negative regulatory protein PaaX [Pseudomonadota bacterium]